MSQFQSFAKNALCWYSLLMLLAGLASCTAAPDSAEGCRIVDLKNDAPTPFANIDPQNFGDLVKLSREYPERKLRWCDDGQITVHVD